MVNHSEAASEAGFMTILHHIFFPHNFTKHIFAGVYPVLMPHSVHDHSHSGGTFSSIHPAGGTTAIRLGQSPISTMEVLGEPSGIGSFWTLMLTLKLRRVAPKRLT